MRQNNRRYVIVSMSLLILTILLVTAFTAYQQERQRNPLLTKQLTQAQGTALFTTYISPGPDIRSRQVLGKPTAPITIIAYVDFTPASKEFITTLLPQVQREYIDKGVVRYYHKNHISRADIESKSANFQYAQILSCVEKLKPEEYYTLYSTLFSQTPQEALKTIHGYGIGEEQLNACLNDTSNLAEDAAEVERLGLVGLAPQLFIGINGKDNMLVPGTPSYERLQRDLREYEVRIGE